MFRNLKRKFAKLALVAMTLQLAVVGLGTGATGAHAIVGTDLISPTIDSIVYGGESAVLNANNVYVLDVSNSEDITLQSAAVVVSEDSTVDVSFSGSTIVSDYTLVAGSNVLDIATMMGSPVTLTGLQTYATAGNITLDLLVQDTTNPASKYQLVLSVFDMVKPTINAVSFNTALATNNLNVWSFDTTGLSDEDLATMKVKLGVSEPSTLEFTDFNYDFDLATLETTLNLSDMVGFDVTNQYLRDNATGGKIILRATLSDSSANATNYEFEFLLDTVAPIVEMTSKPIIVNDVKKAIEVTFTGNEDIKLKSATNVEFSQGALLYTGVAVQTSPIVITVIIPADTFVAGVTPIDVATTFADVALNETVFDGQIRVDTEAPLAVTGLTTFVDDAGHVRLTWVNPTVGTYTTLRVVRDGTMIVVLDPSDTTYLDMTTTFGGTYKYVVIVGDAAGNETGTPQVTVNVPAPVVAAAVSDTYVPEYNDISQTDTNTEEVKADTTTSEDDATDEEDGFPVWGIVLLLILAAVGGYLIWNQKPAPVVAPVATKKKNTSNKKK